jgi:hypothetical protein
VTLTIGDETHEQPWQRSTTKMKDLNPIFNEHFRAV